MSSNILEKHCEHGAGDGNRTHTASLEGWSSTIEQRPLPCAADLKHPGGPSVNPGACAAECGGGQERIRTSVGK